MPTSTQAMLLRIFTEESRQAHGRPVYEHIVLKARERGLAGATVLRGPMGFGRSHRLHTAKILDLSAKLPLVIEIVDEDQRLRAFIEELRSIASIGLVTLEKVEVIRFGEPPDGG